MVGILHGESARFCESLDLTEVQESYHVSVERLKFRKGRIRRSGSRGALVLLVDQHIRSS
jgi:hypothetical protein